MAIVLDGTSGITTPTIAATSASTFTGALALPSGGLNVGSGQLAVDASGRVTMPYQPCVTAALSGGGNGMTGGGEILWNQVLVNNGSHYNAATGRFTAPVAGFYRMSIGGLAAFAGGTAGSATLLPYKNGATIGGQYGRAFYEQTSSTGAKYVQMFGQWIIQCAAGDTLSAHGSLYRELSAAYSSFTIELVG